LVRRRLTRAVLAGVMLCGFSWGGYCASGGNATQPPVAHYPSMSMLPRQFAPKGATPAWATSKWLPDRNTSQSISMIDKLAENHKLTITTIESFRGSQTPADVDSGTNDVFLYGLYRGYTEHLPVQPLMATALQMSAISTGTNVTRSYARNLFLCFAMLKPFGNGEYYWMVDLGKRLLAEDPNDYDVMFGNVRVSRPETSSQQKVRMLALADKMIALKPKDKRSYNAEYDIYMPCYLSHVSGNISDANGAIAAMRKRIEFETDPETISEYKDIISKIINLRDEPTQNKEPVSAQVPGISAPQPLTIGSSPTTPSK